jgi:hypothetical protein
VRAEVALEKAGLGWRGKHSPLTRDMARISFPGDRDGSAASRDAARHRALWNLHGVHSLNRLARPSRRTSSMRADASRI